MGVRRHIILTSAALAVLGLPAVASAGEVPTFDPVATVTTPVAVGGEIDAEMACEPTDPGFEGETPIPTFEMVPPSGGIVAPDTSMGDAGTVFATWTATEAGEWGLFVTCNGTTKVWTAIVTAPTASTAPTTPPPTTPATLPSTGNETGTATVAAALVGAGVLAVLVARRRLDA